MTTDSTTKLDQTPVTPPDIMLPVQRTFGIDVPLQAPAYSRPSPYTPRMDPDYRFDRITTLAVLSGFAHDRRVLVHGYHGTGKSSHIEQIAARLNWPCLRINLDSDISRGALVGVADASSETGYREGTLSWSVQRPVALILDEYDAGRPEILFVIQRLLEADGQLGIPEQNRTLSPHPGFRLFATANTVGLGDETGLYAGTRTLNQAQLDRWNVLTRLDYIDADTERRIALAKVPAFDNPGGQALLDAMIDTAQRIRSAFVDGDLPVVMTPRTLLIWAQNTEIFQDVGFSFMVSYLNRLDRDDHRAHARRLYETGMRRELDTSGARASIS